jgi:hypothetical protein
MNDKPLSQNQIAQLPEEFSIPAQLLEKWFQIPDSNYLEFRLTRRDLDKLFNSLYYLCQAQYATHNTLIKWSNGETEQANQNLIESSRNLINSQNSLKQFFMSIMVSATSTSHAVE